MSYYYVARCEEAGSIKEYGIIAGANGIIPLLSKIKAVDTFAVDFMKGTEYSIFRILPGGIKGALTDWPDESIHSPYLFNLHQNCISPEFLDFLGEADVSMKSYYLELLKHNFHIAKRADKITLTDAEGNVHQANPEDLIDYYINNYFVPQNISISFSEILDYINEIPVTFYFVGMIEQLDEIKERGIESWSHGMIPVITDMSAARKVAYDFFETTEYCLFKILSEGINGEIMGCGDSSGFECRKILIQDRISLAYVELLEAKTE